jgi:hypothetical protein
VLFRLAYLGVTNTLALLRLVPMSDRDKDAEILALRHQIAVLERHLHGEKIRFTWADRALLAALLHRLPRDALRRIRLLVRPETVSRWHHHLIAYRQAMISRPRQAERPPTVRSIRRLVLRLARENSTWGTAESTVNCSCWVSKVARARRSESPSRRSPRLSGASRRVTNSQVPPETRGRSAGLDRRRIPHNMGTRRHQPERRGCGGRGCVAAAAERTTVIVTHPGRTRPCCELLR